MSSISRTRNPLIHSGTSQYERLLQALTPSYFKIDDRSIKDLLHATFQYAECLHYYDENNQRRGHWQCFWKVEMLTFLAHLSTIDVEAILQGYEDIKEAHRQLDTSELDTEERQAKNNEYLLSLIEYLRGLAFRIEEMVLYLPDELPLKKEIIALIEKDTLTDTEQLASELARLVQFHKEAYKQVHDTRLPASEYEALFKPYWGIPDRIFFDIELDADSSYQSNEQEDLDQLLKNFEQTFRKIKLRANYWFDLNIDTPQLRQPHVALFLTFLRLFDHARNSLNNLTKKHLEFYYEKILCLDTRAAVPDDAHLILELAATVDQHLIQEGTKFVAGKDKDGKPLLFQTLENWFLNRAQVKNIKTTYLDICGVFRDDENKQTKRIYATPDVTTAYRYGEEQPNESKDYWRSMGDNPDLPDGEIGFAIASPQLILREGRREIDIEMSVCQDLPTDANGNINNLPFEISELGEQEYFKIRLSSEEEWQRLEYVEDLDPNDTFDNPSFSIKIENLEDNEDTNKRNYTISIKIVLERDHLPVVALGEELNLEDGYNSEWPVLTVQILPKTLLEYPTASIYEALRSIEIREIIITVDVDDVQENLIVQNDQGVFDGTQKFYPFGPVPEIGDKFYIGSTEIFQKALETLQVKFDWIAPPKFDTYYDGYLDDTEEFKKPFLDIKFIDRAVGEDASLPPRLGISGNSSTESIESLKGRVTDKNANGLVAIEIEVRTSLNTSEVLLGEGGIVVINQEQVVLTGKVSPALELNAIRRDSGGNEEVIIIDGVAYQIVNGQIQDESGNTDEIDQNSLELLIKVETDEEGFYEIKLNQTLINSESEIKFKSPDSTEYDNLPSEYDPPDSDNPLTIKGYTEINVSLYPPRVTNGENPPVGIEPTIHPIIDILVQATFNPTEPAFEYSNGNIGRITEGFELSNTLEQEAWLFPLEISQATTIDVPVGEIPNTSILIKFFEPTENALNPLIKNINISVDGIPLDNNNLPQHLGGYYRIDNIESVDNIQIEYSGGVSLPLIIPRESNFESTTVASPAEELQPINTYVIKHFIPKFTKKINISGSIFAFADEADNKLSEVNIQVKGLEGDYNANNFDDELSFQLQDVPVIDGKLIILQLILNGNNTPIELEISSDNYSDIINKNIILFPTPFEPATPVGPIGDIEDDEARITVQLADELSFNTGIFIQFSKSENRGDVDDILEDDFKLTFDGNTKEIDIEFPPDEFEGDERNERITAQISRNGVTIQHDFEIQLRKQHNTLIKITLFNNEANNFTRDNSRGECSIRFNTFGDDLYDIGKIFLDSEELENIDNDLIILDNLGGNAEFRKPNFQPITIANPSNNCYLEINFLPYPIYNKIEGRVTDVFDDELSNVEVQIAELKFDAEEGEYVIDENGKYEINNTLFVGQSSDQDGVFNILIPSTFQPADLVNQGLIFNADNFIPTVLRSGFVERTNLQIILYNQLNIFPLIDNDDCIIEEFDINISTLSLTRDVRTQNFTQYSPTLKRGFIQFKLQEADFLHGEYQNVLIASTIQASADASSLRSKIHELIAEGDSVTDTELREALRNTSTDFVLPNPPYTPATNSIRLCYTSTQIITGGENKGIDDYFHLYPFKGYAERPLQKVEDDGTVSGPDLNLLPQYANPTFNPKDPTEIANGNLYIGLEQLTPGANLSLLIQIKEGSEQNPDVEVPEVSWSYLAKDNEWKPLSRSKILTDTTNGLKKTGIFQLTTPSDMSNETTLFKGNCHWLRASVVEKADKNSSEVVLPDDCNGATNETTTKRAATQLAIGLPSIIDIRAQAIQVQFLNQENELSHLAQPLPDGTIQQLLISQSQVKAVEHPFPSFNGRLAEAGDAFYMRVSERLRHRDRAVTIYDYERLLLERFPKIQRAKCLNHTKPGSINVLENPDAQLVDTELAPGYVTVAVIPKFSGRTGEAATEPRFSKGDLEDMEQYLRTKTNLFVASKDRLLADYLRVVNPIYEEVRLCFAVQFKAGEAPESRRFDLDRALKGFLSPWLFDNEFDIPFGKRMNRSNIIHFLENQGYVDAIANFKMIHCGVEVLGNEIVPTTSRSILTSVIDEDNDPNSTDHTIHTVDDICDETELADLDCEN